MKIKLNILKKIFLLQKKKKKTLNFFKKNYKKLFFNGIPLVTSKEFFFSRISKKKFLKYRKKLKKIKNRKTRRNFRNKNFFYKTFLKNFLSIKKLNFKVTNSLLIKIYKALVFKNRISLRNSYNFKTKKYLQLKKLLKLIKKHLRKKKLFKIIKKEFKENKLNKLTKKLFEIIKKYKLASFFSFKKMLSSKKKAIFFINFWSKKYKYAYLKQFKNLSQNFQLMFFFFLLKFKKKIKIKTFESLTFRKKVLKTFLKENIQNSLQSTNLLLYKNFTIKNKLLSNTKKKKEEVETSALYKKLIGTILKNGKKIKAIKIVESALKLVQNKLKISKLQVLTKLIKKLKIFVIPRKIRVRRHFTTIPFPINKNQQIYFIAKWLTKGMKRYKKKTSIKQLFLEITRTLKGEHSFSKRFKKFSVHKAVENRSNMHYRW